MYNQLAYACCHTPLYVANILPLIGRPLVRERDQSISSDLNLGSYKLDYIAHREPASNYIAMQRLLERLPDWLAAWNAIARQHGIAEIRHVRDDDGTWQLPLHFSDHVPSDRINPDGHVNNDRNNPDGHVNNDRINPDGHVNNDRNNPNSHVNNDHVVNAGPEDPPDAVHRPRRMATKRPRNHGVATMVRCVRNTQKNQRCRIEVRLVGYEGEDYDCGRHD